MHLSLAISCSSELLYAATNALWSLMSWLCTLMMTTLMCVFSPVVRTECRCRTLSTVCRRWYDRLCLPLLPSTPRFIWRHCTADPRVVTVTARCRLAAQHGRSETGQCPAQSWTAAQQVSWPSSCWWGFPRTPVHGRWRPRSSLSGLLVVTSNLYSGVWANRFLLSRAVGLRQRLADPLFSTGSAV